MKNKHDFERQQQRLYELKKSHPTDYAHLYSISKSHDYATKQLKESVGNASLTKLKNRMWIAENSFGVTGVSLDGIKETADVREYIHELEESGVVTKGASSLKLTHPKIHRRY